MNLTPEQLEAVIERTVEKAITKSFIKYLKITVGVPLVLIAALVVFAIVMRT